MWRSRDGSRSPSLVQAIAGTGRPLTRQFSSVVLPSSTSVLSGFVVNFGGAAGKFGWDYYLLKFHIIQNHGGIAVKCLKERKICYLLLNSSRRSVSWGAEKRREKGKERLWIWYTRPVIGQFWQVCQHSSVTYTDEKCSMAAVSVKWGRRSYTSITGRDICTFSVLFSVSHLTFLTRVYKALYVALLGLTSTRLFDYNCLQVQYVASYHGYHIDFRQIFLQRLPGNRGGGRILYQQ